jgi:Flp pilus assembly CpaF family ATPase
MTTDLGSRISESDDPEPVDSSLVREIVDAVNAQLEEYAAANGSLTNEATREMAKNLIMRQLEEHTFTSADAGRGVMSASEEITVMEAVLERMFGIGPFGPLLADEEVEDIYVCGAEPVVLKYFGGRKETRPPIADSDKDLLNQVTSIATHQGMNEREVTAARPFLNMDLPGYDARLALIFDVTPHPMVTIRRHRFVNVHLEHLVKWGTISRSMMAFLHAAVVGKRSLLIVGPQSAGKTTMLRALAQCISSEERFATLETEFELLLHTIPGRFRLLMPVEERVGGGDRDASGKPAGEITMGDAFPWTLRHSLERIILGEARSQEIVSLLRAMSRGYRGSMASFHADTVGEIFESMATLLIDYAPSLTHEAAMRQIATALDYIVFIDREQVTDRATGEPTEIRFVSEIIQVGKMTSDSPAPMTAEIFGPPTDSETRLLDPRGYPRGPLPLDENLWARHAGLDMAWLKAEHGAWDSAFPIRGFA